MDKNLTEAYLTITGISAALFLTVGITFMVVNFVHNRMRDRIFEEIKQELLK